MLCGAPKYIIIVFALLFNDSFAASTKYPGFLNEICEPILIIFSYFL
ncbi:Hypothetical protein MCYN_0777 [Mycoplasmopsis cynos C142]|uniref:Uncharacterized protein n=1 Tax=Mycoplasmopsis cynos (strain C142) TaxID=1246955 RepID=L0RV71_MYCC1|nr:Hypothetical protein MCYN_0777 [Mycoplasmopsis cynos C142]